MYDGSLVSTMGRAQIRFNNPATGRAVQLTCRVLNKDVMPILSLTSSVDLGLIEVKDVDPLNYIPNMSRAEDPSEVTTKSALMTKFRQVFNTAEPGRVINGHAIVTDPQVAPEAEPPRRV